MKFSKTITALLVSGLTCLTFNSCWFNSTGQMVDSVYHKAKAWASDAEVGNYVYTNGYDYYVKLDHVYNDDEPSLLLGGEQRTSYHRTYNLGREWFRVNKEFGRYITGESDQFAYLSSVEAVDYSTAMAGTYPRMIIRSVNQTLEYTYESPDAGWAYFWAPFEFLCIDVPMSAALSAGYVTLFFLAAAAAAEKSRTSGGSSYGSYYDAGEAARRQAEQHAEDERMNAQETSYRLMQNGGY